MYIVVDICTVCIMLESSLIISSIIIIIMTQYLLETVIMIALLEYYTITFVKVLTTSMWSAPISFVISKTDFMSSAALLAGSSA